MAGDVVLEILKGIQDSIVDLDRKIDAVDGKVTRHRVILTLDTRMIRSAIHEMGETHVTEGEITALHEDVNRVQQGLDDLVTRVEMLESQQP
jgi:ubiquinone biosynthesis protein UbiJ